MDLACVYLALTIFVAFLAAPSYAENDLDCPENCTCDQIDKLICKNVDYIPLFDERPRISVLSITNHTITSLTLADFVNFTKLSYLTINGGRIEKLMNDSFLEIHSTVTMIDLSHNHIKTIEKGTFTNLSALQTLILNFNELTVLESGLFANLPNLVTLKLEFNSINEFQPEVFKNAPILENLNLYSNKLTVIPWEGMRHLSGLKQLHLSSNLLARVGENTDVYLESLEDLVLSNNPIWSIGTFPNVSMSLSRLNLGFTNIEHVSSYTWQHIPEVEHLFLDGTRFTETYEGMFDGLKFLKNLYMTDLNYLAVIGPRSFSNLNNLYMVDISRNKMLTTIHKDAFVDSRASVVKIMDCGLTNFHQDLLKWDIMLHVHVAPNPINCDCNAKWLTNSSIYGNSTDIPTLKCALPENLESRKVTSLSPDSFVCTYSLDRKRRFAVGIFCAIVLVVAFGTFAIVFRCRHKIMASCRRHFMYRRYRNDMIFTVEHDTSVAELDDTEGRPLKEVRLETVPLEENA